VALDGRWSLTHTMRLATRFSTASLFVLPFAVLLVLWAVLVPYLNAHRGTFILCAIHGRAGIDRMLNIG
jgi:hypothetical protein